MTTSCAEVPVLVSAVPDHAGVPLDEPLHLSAAEYARIMLGVRPDGDGTVPAVSAFNSSI
jgi:hypothetical protein